MSELEIFSPSSPPDSQEFGPFLSEEETRLLRRYFDPQARLAELSLQAMVGHVAEFKPVVEVPRLGPIEGEEVVLTEAVDLGLFTRPSDSFGIGKNRQAEIIDSRMRYAEEIAEVAVAVVADQKALFARQRAEMRRAGGRMGDLPSDILLGAKVLTMTAQDGRLRRNAGRYGKQRLYYDHPDGVTSLQRLATMQTMGPFFDPIERDLTSAASLGHDDPEDLVKADGSHLSEEIAVTPLVIKKTILKHNILQPDQHWMADQASLATVLVMRNHGSYGPAGPSDARMDYLESVRSMAYHPGLAGVMARIIKAADLHYNKVIDKEEVFPDAEDFEIRIQKLDLKQAKYTQAEQIIHSATNELTPEYSRLIARIQRISREEVRDDIRMKFRLDPPQIAAEMRHGVERLRFAA